ncbi:AI-2E family transporter [Flavonifractor sp. An82]|nr:AI-2E family transporter [Flavonifractor sp. An82]
MELRSVMDKKLFKSILLIITYAVVLVMVLARLDVLAGALGILLSVFKPLIIGFCLAFVLNRPCQFFFRLYSRGLDKISARGAARPLAVLTSYLALIIIVVAIFSFVLPKLVESIQTFVLNLSGYIANAQNSINHLLDYLNLDIEQLDLSKLNTTLEGILNNALKFLSNLGPQIIEFTTGLVSIVVTGVLALVFSIYMLSGRDKLLGQCRRLLKAYVPAKVAGPISDVVSLTAATFTKFVTGQCIEACILGGLCTIGMLFIQPDYAPLIGVTVGASALIPVAGAYIGAILSAVLLLMVSPLKAFIFLVFLIILQQVEGNVIYPRVVGTSLGLPGIWVLAAVTVGGSLWGVPGILVSVPIASVAYTLLRRDLRKRLDKPAV